MLQVRRLVLVLFLFASVLDLSGDQVRQPQNFGIHAKARVVGQKYCRGDADLFVVSVKLDIEVSNSSKDTVRLPRNMIPWVARVAASSEEANAGHYLYEVTWSHYLQDSAPRGSLLIRPGKSVTLHSGYDFVARYDPAFSYPKSLSRGRYAVALVLRPESGEPPPTGHTKFVQDLTTDLFLIDVPDHPNTIDCEARAR